MEDIFDNVATALRLRREPVLPLSSYDRPVRSRLRNKLPRPRVPAMTYAQVATYLWILASLILVLMGYISCTTSASRATLICTSTSCTFERHYGSSYSLSPRRRKKNSRSNYDIIGQASAPSSLLERITFLREHLVGAMTTRTRNGEAVPFEVMRRRRQRVLGHSFLVKYKRRLREGEGSSGDKLVDDVILFSKHNIGRKRARRQAAAINKFVRGEVDRLDVLERKNWSAFGVLMMVLGLASALFAALIGDITGHGPWIQGNEEDEEEDDKDR